MQYLLSLACVIFLLVFEAEAKDIDEFDALTNIYSSIKAGNLPLLQNQPIYIKSSVSDSRLSADVYAIKKTDFNTLVEKLSQPQQWCRFITLHLNIKACTYQLRPQSMLNFYAGRKFYQPAENAFELNYRFDVIERRNNIFKLTLSAESGPFGTEDYLIRLNIIKKDDDVLVHMALSYLSSFSSRLGASVYLSTIGADKVGFSKILSDKGEEKFIAGVEGIIERNVMRYYLALSVFLETTDEKKYAENWFDATEQFRQQLHEVERNDYLNAKQKEFAQQLQMQLRINTGFSVFEEDNDD